MTLIYKLEKAPQVVKDVLDELRWEEYNENVHQEEQWNLCWRNTRPKPSELSCGKSYQKYNHFPKTGLLTLKDKLCRVIRKMRNIYGNLFNYTPLTFILPNEYIKFVEEYTNQKKKNVWICKPSDLSRGRKIFLLKDITSLTYDSQFIIQKYVEHPLLIGGYKWDMRIYVLMTQAQPMKIYLYKEGLVRFSSEKFDLSSINNKFSHLTNSSINKASPFLYATKDVIGSGCKWTFRKLKLHFRNNGQNFNTLWAKIQIIIIATMINLLQVVPNVSCSFELFGFDILVDESLRPWLLEVNASPALEVVGAVDEEIKPQLIKDIISCVKFENYDSYIERIGSSIRTANTIIPYSTFGYNASMIYRNLNQVLTPTPNNFAGGNSIVKKASIQSSTSTTVSGASQRIKLPKIKPSTQSSTSASTIGSSSQDHESNCYGLSSNCNGNYGVKQERVKKAASATFGDEGNELSKTGALVNKIKNGERKCYSTLDYNSPQKKSASLTPNLQEKNPSLSEKDKDKDKEKGLEKFPSQKIKPKPYNSKSTSRSQAKIPPASQNSRSAVGSSTNSHRIFYNSKITKQNTTPLDSQQTSNTNTNKTNTTSSGVLHQRTGSSAKISKTESQVNINDILEDICNEAENPDDIERIVKSKIQRKIKEAIINENTNASDVSQLSRNKGGIHPTSNSTVVEVNSRNDNNEKMRSLVDEYSKDKDASLFNFRDSSSKPSNSINQFGSKVLEKQLGGHGNKIESKKINNNELNKESKAENNAELDSCQCPDSSAEVQNSFPNKHSIFKKNEKNINISLKKIPNYRKKRIRIPKHKEKELKAGKRLDVIKDTILHHDIRQQIEEYRQICNINLPRNRNQTLKKADSNSNSGKENSIQMIQHIISTPLKDINKEVNEYSIKKRNQSIMHSIPAKQSLSGVEVTNANAIYSNKKQSVSSENPIRESPINPARIYSPDPKLNSAHFYNNNIPRIPNCQPFKPKADLVIAQNINKGEARPEPIHSIHHIKHLQKRSSGNILDNRETIGNFELLFPFSQHSEELAAKINRSVGCDTNNLVSGQNMRLLVHELKQYEVALLKHAENPFS